jgi:hypothetical protein
MGGDGIEVWIILSHARSLIYIRYKTGCGSGKNVLLDSMFNP